jgi:hypothetical protein
MDALLEHFQQAGSLLGLLTDSGEGWRHTQYIGHHPLGFMEGPANAIWTSLPQLVLPMVYEGGPSWSSFFILLPTDDILIGSTGRKEHLRHLLCMHLDLQWLNSSMY